MIDEKGNIPTQVDPPPPPKNLSEDRGVIKAAAIIAIGNVISRILGLVREVVKATLFGTSDLLGAFTVASLVPMTLFNLITGGEMVSSSLVPVFSDYAAKDKREELWGIASTFLSLALLVLLALVIFVLLFTPTVAQLAGAGNFSNPTLFNVTLRLMRLATPAVLFLSIASILTGLLYALKRFTLPAFTAAIFNSTMVVVALLRPDRIESLVWGLLIGSFLQIVLQLPALRDGRIRPRLMWRHPAVRRIIVLYTPIVAGLIVNQVAIWISFNFAILTGDDSVTFMTYATTLVQFPQGLVVTALSMATLPTLSRLATAYTTAAGSIEANERLAEFKQTLAGGIRLVLTLILPATTGLFALATPIVGLLLERGQFLPSDTIITSQVLRIYLIGLPFAAIDQMLVFASYARKDTWRPALVGVVSVIFYTIVAWLLLEPLGLFSLMVADAAKHILHTGLMLWILSRYLGEWQGFRIGVTAVKSLAAALLTGLAAYGAASLIQLFLPGLIFWERALIVIVGGGAGFIVFMVMARLLNIPEALNLVSLVKDKIVSR